MSLPTTLPTTTARVPPSPPGSDSDRGDFPTTSPYPPLPPSTSASPASSNSVQSSQQLPPSPESPYARYQSYSEDDGSDVEIYLNDLGLDDSASRMHVHMHRSLADPRDGPVPGESPVLPAGCSSSESLSLSGLHVSHPPLPQAQGAGVTSPQLPSAPTQSTIPLPDVSPDFRPARVAAINQLPEQSSAFTIYDLPIPSQPQTHPTPFTFAPIGPSPPQSTFDIGQHQQKTPNVYINGLPPHFPEDQLFALASPFGEIRSVRTFTRHVRESESGYGFVLFETVDAAERCIISLRRYRNLHPTFSKQIHKIPGTSYATTLSSPSTQIRGLSTQAGEWDPQVGDEHEHAGDGEFEYDPADGDAGFKAKMEALHDPTSTNLYMEGLPLSIDEPTLAALVSPHRISSSRFFQTRLSNPPRIIAFVRLETRAGAEEIIDRLHGRMVRGWNDTGSRISVRFADTAEQRELRRNERSTKEGVEGSPARLTIAQAALLNLRGQELRPSMIKTGPVIHAHAHAQQAPLPPPSSIQRSHGNGRLSIPAVPDFSSNAPFTVDYSLAPGRPVRSQAHSPHPYIGDGQAVHPSSTSPHPVDPSMITLLQTLRGNGIPYRGGLYEDDASTVHLDLLQKQQQHHYARPPPVHTRTGYTATEEYIMRAHAESTQQQQRRRPAPLDLRPRSSRRVAGGAEEDLMNANIALGVRGYRTQASQVHLASPGIAGGGAPMSEDDFHNNGWEGRYHVQPGSVQRSLQSQHQQQTSSSHMVSTPTDAQYYKQQQEQQYLQEFEQQQQEHEQRQQQQEQQHNYHIRSTTLPHRNSRATNSGAAQATATRHYQHSSMSVLGGSGVLKTPQHASVAKMANGGEELTNANINVNAAGGGGKYEQHQGVPPSAIARNGSGGGYDQQQNLSPSLISPALTYSSTPSTLSPATPFFGSFTGNHGDGLFGAGIVDGSGNGVERERGVQVNLGMTSNVALKNGLKGVVGR